MKPCGQTPYGFISVIGGCCPCLWKFPKRRKHRLQEPLDPKRGQRKSYRSPDKQPAYHEAGQKVEENTRQQCDPDYPQRPGKVGQPKQKRVFNEPVGGDLKLCQQGETISGNYQQEQSGNTEKHDADRPRRTLPEGNDQ